MYISQQDTPFYLNTKSKIDKLKLTRIDLSEDGMSSLSLLNDEDDIEKYLLHMQYPTLGSFIGSFVPPAKEAIKEFKDFKIRGLDI